MLKALLTQLDDPQLVLCTAKAMTGIRHEGQKLLNDLSAPNVNGRLATQVCGLALWLCTC